MDKHYFDYYHNQNGSGLSHIGTLYTSPQIVQQGRGVGSFFSGLFRNIKPLFLSGLNAIKNQVAETSKAVISDFGHKPLRNILEEQSKIALHNLSDKAVNKISKKMQRGSGKKNIKRRSTKKKSHLKRRSTRKHTKKKTIKNKIRKLKLKVRDIFT